MKSLKTRIYFTFTIFILLFGLVLTKAFYVQVVSRDKLMSYSRGQILRQTKIYPKRGSIYDRNNNPLAINVRKYNIFTMPKELQSNFYELNELQKVVPKLNIGKIKRAIKKRNKYTWIARSIVLDDLQVKKINELKGIYLETSISRFYPNKSLMSQMLGFVGIDNVGLSGVEYKFDEFLKGKAQIIKYLQDAKGRPIKFETAGLEEKATDIKLSLDKNLQAVAEKHLAEAVIKHNAEKGGVGIMNAVTGEILAMANYPSFNPNAYKKYSNNDLKLAFISDPFEPGSIFKALTVASALENKIIRPDTNYFCERGKLQVGNHIISEASDAKKHEWLSVTEIMKYSSNIGTTKIAFDLTYPRLKETLIKFKIGQKTDIELPGESRGIFNNETNVKPLTLSNISFGQGIATTGIQMLQAYAVFANGGFLVKPTIVSGRKNPVERILSEQTTSEVNKMLIDSVETGTGDKAKVKYFKIAGKTSTAQRVSETGGYQGYISGFIGYPVGIENPFVIFVYVENPKNKLYYGNDVAAPVFRSIAQYMLYRDRKIEDMAFEHKDEDNSTIVDMVKTNQSSLRYLGEFIVPNFIGLDKASSKKLADKSNLSIEFEGVGIVTRQTIMPGEKTSEGKNILLYLKPPQL